MKPWCARTARKNRILLKKENAGRVFMGEEELAHGMTRFVLERVTARAAKGAVHGGLVSDEVLRALWNH